MTNLSLPQTGYSQTGYATVLIFHRFGDKRYPTTSVSLKDFKKEMLYLKKHHFNVISLKKLYELSKEGKIPPKTVVITIDDGYRTTKEAYKILKQLKFPFTVFLYMEAVGRYPDFLTKKDLLEMEKSGIVDFENHLYSHPNLAKWRIELTKKEYFKKLKEEKELSERKFQKIFHRKPIFLAFPYGDYDKISVEFFKNSGYKLLLTQDRGSFSSKGILVPRMAVVGSQSGFKTFVENLKIEPLPVVKHFPDFGLQRVNSFRPTFTIKNPENYRNCWIYATDNGWIKARKEGNVVRALSKVTLKKYATRIGIRCWNKKTGRKAEFFYLVLKGENPLQKIRKVSHQ